MPCCPVDLQHKVRQIEDSFEVLLVRREVLPVCHEVLLILYQEAILYMHRETLLPLYRETLRPLYLETLLPL